MGMVRNRNSARTPFGVFHPTIEIYVLITHRCWLPQADVS